jgi:hypothetical protein
MCSFFPIVIRTKSLVIFPSKCLTRIPSFLSLKYTSLPGTPFFEAKTKFALDGKTFHPMASIFLENWSLVAMILFVTEL